MYAVLCAAGVLRLGEGTPSYDGEMEVDEQLPWEHITGKVVQEEDFLALLLFMHGMCTLLRALLKSSCLQLIRSLWLFLSVTSFLFDSEATGTICVHRTKEIEKLKGCHLQLQPCASRAASLTVAAQNTPPGKSSPMVEIQNAIQCV
eukprot:1156600-Pelagomonas_calceolata.AAC.2